MLDLSLAVSVLQPWMTCSIPLGWGLVLPLAPVWVPLGRPLDRTFLETCLVLIVQLPAGSVQLTVTPLLLPTRASLTLVSTPATVTSYSAVAQMFLCCPIISHHLLYTHLTLTQKLQISLQFFKSAQLCLTNHFSVVYNVCVTFVPLLAFA